MVYSSSRHSTSSEDELNLSQDGSYHEGTPAPSPKTKHNKMRSSVLSYAPGNDEPDSPETDDQPVAAPQKRKYEAPKAEDDADHDSPPVKKAQHAPPDSKVTASPVKKAKPAAEPRIEDLIIKYEYNDSDDESDDSVHYVVGGQKRRKSAVYDDDKNYVPDRDNDDNDPDEEAYVIPDNEKENIVFDFNRERERRLAYVLNIPKDMYTEKENFLFLRLAMRGFDTLAPKHWQFDFPTLPDSLFPEEGKKKADPIIQLNRSTNFYAIKSLANLFSLSGRVRDCSIVEKRPENLIKQTIKKYLRWALFDVNLEISRGSLPIHVIHAQNKQESIRDALSRLNKRLKKLAKRHRQALHDQSGNLIGAFEDFSTDQTKAEIPLLIGFLICGPLLFLITYDLSLMKGDDGDEDINGKFFSHFDFSERGQDVWNSLSLAIVIMYIRNTMVRLSQHGHGGFVKALTSGARSEDI